MLDTVFNIIIGLISNFIFFALGAIFHKIWLRTKQVEKNEIWRMLSNDKLVIALSIRDGTNTTSTPRASIAEVIALTEILPVFKQLNINFKIVDNYSNVLLQDYNNFLSIGGPNANHLTSVILKKYNNKLPIKILLSPAGFEIGNKKYETVYSADNSKIEIDYAAVLVICDKSDEHTIKNNIVIMGCRGYGTQGGVLSISNKELIKKHKRYKRNKSFVAIIKVEIGENGLLHTKVEDFFPLDIFD